MKSQQSERIMDYLSCTLDDVVNKEKRSGKKSFLNLKHTQKYNYKSRFLSKKDLTQSSSGYRGRGGGGRSKFTSSRTSGSFKKPFFSKRLIDKKHNTYQGRKFYSGASTDYFKSRPSTRNSHYAYDTHNIPYNNKYFVNKKNMIHSVKSSGTTYMSGSSIARSKPRKIFKPIPSHKSTVITSSANTYKSVQAPNHKLSNLNISLYRNKRTVAVSNNRPTTNLSVKRNKVITANKSKVVRKGIQKTTIQPKTRKTINGSKFKPLNKYLLSKIKIVTSLNKIPSPLKEQKDTEVNLPESLNNPSARKD
ncbi:conserved Plasmodium protein, unknown function [Plasmodium knowlesi strain H]|uniref:Uncharacterized protein n=3 Tax=Plasmodium knowlesi TaxID=5850 RepID=A0A5K1UJN3_PLAKH|nr:conserved Plasmodium protein, unknown function [Plasmodium knowlesi strain H]OTN66758.1 Uncharacterized protein PKNOH_S08498800 [Plasmodium knowlesi]CAA9986743.1 conserved Plasmodium protein, unknown function [Plasmodium knowlesi strain H]SBO23567.1 conserved Plasmodium protein, unknown function [Plasmodium knowlesi strain H]SBO25102.1 conserved Plasmodium protein, unknown function [Plasmodium knowlesi strain H]VVS76217.1 conserved Plasmodium protein, unknown function [Plasmodium knowlesi s|eukprot:XP_002257927.1 hypothetical protein, conserved in Plasmodium species [Plasmodium knowlesi strain H]